MPTYTCETCEKAFKQKAHYDKHKARKRPCKKDTTIDALVEKKVLEILAKQNVLVPLPAHPTQPTAVKPNPVKPFLKWVGGKTQILEEVLAKFPKEMVNYYEPFLGGGSVLLGLLSYAKAGLIKIAGKVYASDLNSNLIGVYKNIQSNPETLITEVKKLVAEFAKAKGSLVNRKPSTLEEALTSPESYYFWVRSRFNALSKDQRMTCPGSAMFLFLNKTCFRGVYREGPNGFNVPFGNYTNPTILEEDHIQTISELIKNVVFTVAPFSESLANVQPGDFAYLDPPYAPETDTSFVSYTADGFDLSNHTQLFKRCAEFNALSVKFLMSNADVPLVKESFPSPAYITTVVECRRAIHSKKPGSKTNEVLIQNSGSA